MPLSAETHVTSFVSTRHVITAIPEHSHMTSITARINRVDDLLIFLSNPVCIILNEHTTVSVMFCFALNEILVWMKWVRTQDKLTLRNEDGIFQVCWRWVVIVHLVCHKNNEPVKQMASGCCIVLFIWSHRSSGSTNWVLRTLKAWCSEKGFHSPCQPFIHTLKLRHHGYLMHCSIGKQQQNVQFTL